MITSAPALIVDVAGKMMVAQLMMECRKYINSGGAHGKFMKQNYSKL
jgi:hypothetical protein